MRTALPSTWSPLPPSAAPAASCRFPSARLRRSRACPPRLQAWAPWIRRNRSSSAHRRSGAGVARAAATSSPEERPRALFRRRPRSRRPRMDRPRAAGIPAPAIAAPMPLRSPAAERRHRSPRASRRGPARGGSPSRSSAGCCRHRDREAPPRPATRASRDRGTTTVPPPQRVPSRDREAAPRRRSWASGRLSVPPHSGLPASRPPARAGAPRA